MPYCSSGISQPIPGLQDDLILTSAVAASFLTGGPEWIIPYIGAFTGIISLHLPTFCASDPPADPGVSATDVLTLIAFGPDPGNSGASGRITQLLKRWAWPHVCQCATGSPTPLTPPSAPTGLPAYNPPAVALPPATTPCSTFPHNIAGGGLNQGTGLILAGWSANGTSTAYPTGLAVSSVRFTLVSTAGSPNAGNITVQFQWTHGSSPVVHDLDQNFVMASGTTGVFVSQRQPLSDSVLIRADVAASPTGHTTLVSYLQELFCGGTQPGGTQNPCCPPDLTQTALLQAILQTVTLIQRQAVPFGYVPGTTHAGLSGTGTVAVSGILALAATMTTLPTAIGDRVGTPPRLFDAGWLSLGTSDGYEEPIFLAAQNQLLVPRSAGLVTTVGYSLHSGVVLTLTELLREP
jgi:hypothetical protein